MTPKPSITLRDYRAEDLEAVVGLFQASVHGLAAAHYGAAQRRAWAPAVADLQAWQARLAVLQVRLAEVRGALAGFIGFARNGHIALLYSSPRYARQGVATALYLDAEVSLKHLGAEALFTEASLTAQPFFARQGFHLEQLQRVFRGAVALPRYAMRKQLRPADAGRQPGSAHE